MKKRLFGLLTAIVMIVSLLGVLPAVTASAQIFGDYEYEVLDNGTIELTIYNGNAQTVEIPSTIDGKTVTSIGDDAFFYCESLASITIPNGVTRIGDWAFAISGLTSIIIPDSVTIIGKHAFDSCTSLSEVTIPDGAVIGSGAFLNTPWVENKRKENPLVIVNGTLLDGSTCSGNVVVPEGVTIIGDNAFSGSGLTGITIPNSVTEIGSYAFYECENLESIKLPDGITDILFATFSGCSNLTDITFPNTLKTIGDSAFDECSNLDNITIPASVISIHDLAFFPSCIHAVYYCYSGSYAASWAERKGYTCVIIDDEPATQPTKTDNTDNTVNTNNSDNSSNTNENNNNNSTTTTAAISTTTAISITTATSTKTAGSTSKEIRQVTKDKQTAEKIKKAKISKLTVKSKKGKKITVTWNKVKGAKGYIVQVSSNSKFKKSKILIKKNNVKKIKITIKNKKLKKGKKYYIRVKAFATYKDANGITQRVYSRWNKKLRKVKVK